MEEDEQTMGFQALIQGQLHQILHREIMVELEPKVTSLEMQWAALAAAVVEQGRLDPMRV